LTWPLRTTSGLSPNSFPSGCIFGHKGPIASSTRDGSLVNLAWLTSRMARTAVDLMMPAAEETTSSTISKSYEVGVIKRLPSPQSHLVPQSRLQLEQRTLTVVAARARIDEGEEIT